MLRTKQLFLTLWLLKQLIIKFWFSKMGVLFARTALFLFLGEVWHEGEGLTLTLFFGVTPALSCDLQVYFHQKRGVGVYHTFEVGMRLFGDNVF